MSNRFELKLNFRLIFLDEKVAHKNPGGKTSSSWWRGPKRTCIGVTSDVLKIEKQFDRVRERIETVLSRQKPAGREFVVIGVYIYVIVTTGYIIIVDGLEMSGLRTC